jgi:peptide chain release factor subunit 1
MTDLNVSQEKKIMKRFLSEVTKTEKNLAVYGEHQVRKALEMGVVDILLLSEDLRKYRLTMKCQTCGYIQEKTINEEEVDDFMPPTCPTCKNQNLLVITQKVDLVDELSDLAEKTGATVKLVSRNSEEGESLYTAFSGLAGILRYPLDL